MKENKNFWIDKLADVFEFIFLMGKELFDGVTHDRIDLQKYIMPGTMFAFLLVVRLDLLVGNVFDIDWIKLSLLSRELLVYTSLGYGWIHWSFERARERTKFLSMLTEAFSYCGLVANKKLPAFIEDKVVDDYVRHLKLNTNGIPLSEFESKKNGLESQLNVSIVRIYQEPNDKKRINIVYATRDLPHMLTLDMPDRFADGLIPIGQSHEGEITVNLRDIGHLMVAGQTGGGKSNYEKVVTSVLCENNRDSEIYFLDFKGGMETADLKNRLGSDYRNFSFKESPVECIRELKRIGESLETRFQQIALTNSSTFDEYLKKQQSIHADSNEAQKPLKRIFLIVDEIAQLYSSQPGVNTADVKAAREAVNRIARQGRAAAVHMILATQKPDASSFDQTVKANLPGVLCFSMATQPASVSALGTKRAFDLNPEIKGRAVWKYGPVMKEVQTYLFQ